MSRIPRASEWQDVVRVLNGYDGNNNLLEMVETSIQEDCATFGGRRNKPQEPITKDVLQRFEKGPMEGAEQPDGMTVTMKDYQLQSLHWMLDKVGKGTMMSVEERRIAE